MAEDVGSEDVGSGAGRGGQTSLRTHLLDLYDLGLLSNAPNYDLGEKAERKRSVADLERLFFQAVWAARPKLFVEAGAKDARASRRARSILSKARIVAFEANPYVHERFRARNDEPRHRVEYRHLALSDVAGRVTFNVRTGADGRPLADGRGSLKERAEDEHGTQSVEVEATTLDEFFADTDVRSCALWIDVEGAADKVLTGGRDLLSKAVAVFIEVEDLGDWVWGPAWTVHDVSAQLFDLGLVPVARDYQTRYQYNVLYVSSDLLRNHRFRARLAVHRSGARGASTREPGETTLRGRGERFVRRVGGRLRRLLQARRRR